MQVPVDVELEQRLALNDRIGALTGRYRHQPTADLAHANAHRIGLEPGQRAERAIARGGVVIVVLGARSDPNHHGVELAKVGPRAIEEVPSPIRHHHGRRLKSGSPGQGREEQIDFVAGAVPVFQDVVDVLVSLQTFPPLFLVRFEGLVAQIADLLGSCIELAQLSFRLVVRANHFCRGASDAFGVADELFENISLLACLHGPERIGVTQKAQNVKEVHASLERLFGRHELFLAESSKILNVEPNRSVGLPAGSAVVGKPFRRPYKLGVGERANREPGAAREKLVRNDPVCRGYRRRECNDVVLGMPENVRRLLAPAH